MNDITIQPQGFALAPKNFTEAMEFAKMIALSDLAPPKDYKNKPGNIIVAIQMGNEIGLGPMQSLQNIAVINGRPCVWGDAALALVQASPEFEDIEETVDDNKAVCVIKRRNQKGHTEEFTKADAQKAGLWGKQGPWTQYPKRMMQMRARGFALRNKFADVLRGLNIAEEVRDYVDATPFQEQAPSQAFKGANAIDQAEYVTDPQADELRIKLNEAELSEMEFLTRCKIADLKHLEAHRFEGAVSYLSRLAPVSDGASIAGSHQGAAQ